MQVESFQLFEVISGRKMFDYESDAGESFIRDERLTSYSWTDTGIKLVISNINKEVDFGRYEGSVTIGTNSAVLTLINIPQIIGKSFTCLDTYSKVYGLELLGYFQSLVINLLGSLLYCS